MQLLTNYPTTHGRWIIGDMDLDDLELAALLFRSSLRRTCRRWQLLSTRPILRNAVTNIMFQLVDDALKSGPPQRQSTLQVSLKIVHDEGFVQKKVLMRALHTRNKSDYRDCAGWKLKLLETLAWFVSQVTFGCTLC